MSKNKHAVALGRLGGEARAAALTPEERSAIAKKAAAASNPDTPSKGGLAGGKARAAALTPEQRKEIGRKGAAKRWGKKV